MGIKMYVAGGEDGSFSIYCCKKLLANVWIPGEFFDLI